MPIERWKIIPEFPDYQISIYGRVKSLKHKNEKILKAQINRNHLYVQIRKDNKYHSLYIAYSVLKAFKGPRPIGKYVTYKDKDRLNIKLSNLCYANRKYSLKSFKGYIRNGK